MRALVKAKEEKGIWLQEVNKPQYGPNDVLIKVHQTAICGTDIHIYNWDDWAKAHIKVPLIAGHEFVGEIVALGSEVEDYFKVGERVSGEGHIACHHCRNCRAGRSHLCRLNISVGVTRNGAFADYLAIPATNAYPIPKNIPNQIASILDPLGNAAHTALSFDLVGEDVLITGAGPVGMMAASIARHIGARHVVITDVNPYRLALAKKMGATLAVNTQETPLNDVMKQLNMREGFDVGLEMSGNLFAFRDMLAHMNHAGKVAMLGFLPKDSGIDWSQIIMKGITLKGIYGREMFDTWYKMISMIESGLKLEPVITHEFDVEDYNEAFSTMANGQTGKVILKW